MIPPTVPYEPYVAPTVYHSGQSALKGVFKVDHIPSNLKVLAQGPEGTRSRRARKKG